jgi:hypothetical protein
MTKMNVEMERPVMEAARLFRLGFRWMDVDVREILLEVCVVGEDAASSD